MDIWHGIDNVPADIGDTVVTIGVFDGIHLGHRRLIGTAVERARALGVPAVLMTFDPHPIAVFAPDRAPATLATWSRRAELAREMGIDAIVVLRFDLELAAMSPEDFVGVILADKLHARVVLVGENFTYGHKAAGTTETLPGHAAAHGIDVEVVELLSEGGERVSSTRVRGHLADGDVAAAAECLGRPHRLTGEVIHGQGRGGAQLGFPTANIDVAPELAVPSDGVYAAWFTAEEGPSRTDVDPDGDMELGVRYPAAVSVGTNVTFGDTARTVEAFIIDRSADLYGLTGSIDFVDRIRGMVKFDGVEPLIERMNLDVVEAKKILG
ncbi:bifunctional riboflavin kinase/FAD synthetase [uncultured Corynebacterium sp.]|uniref:bifunctional riboflavin kinase/FAD synthetase n=1 Tax=uncultured Corynebacterium sp. TaxID=159447 RepID=UPI0025ED8FEE|nr:bifunctional riboflavin kinase/FAD synthetase [uncultured Corynebacterium sp.]